jgi:conjugal transfer/type IV secretion protein DotA/TraY
MNYYNQFMKSPMKKLLAILTALILPLIARADAAADSSIFTPTTVPSTDLSMHYLNRIFGNVGPLTGSTSETIIGPLMSIWSSGVLLVGTILAGYIVITGVLKTAHEGEALGQKWSSIWVPIRAAGALGMIVPMASGYSLIQGAVLWCALQGVGLTNMMWEGAQDYMYNHNGAIESPTPVSGYDVTADIMLQLACVEAVNQEILNHNQADPSDPIQQIDMVPLNGSDNTAGFGWGHANGPFPTNTCGGMKYSKGQVQQDATSDSSENAQTEVDKQVAQQKAVQKMVTAMRPVVHQMIVGDAQPVAAASTDPNAQTTVSAPSNTTMPTASQFDTFADIYNAEIFADLQSSAPMLKLQGMAGVAGSGGDVSSMKDQALKDGWASAGAYYAKIAYLNDQAKSFADVKPTSLNTDVQLTGFLINSKVDDAQKVVSQYLEKAAELDRSGLEEGYKQGQGNQSTVGYGDYRKSMKMGEIMGDWSDSTTSSVMHPFMSMESGMIMFMQKEEDPLVRMQDIGDVIMDGVDAVAIAGGATFLVEKFSPAGKAASIAGKIKGVAGKALNDDGLLGKASLFTVIIVLSLLVMGIMLAVVIPMVPTVIWMFGVFSWLLSVVIAVTAAPLWAIAHATPDGDDAIGGGMRGYVLLMAVVLRPPLMLLGMFFGLLLMYAVDMMLTTTFMPAFTMSQSNSIIGLFTGLTGVVMYGVLCFTMTQASFRVTQKLADSVLQWIGGRDDDAIGVEQHTESARGLMVAGIGMGRSAGQSLHQEGKRKQEEKQMKNQSQHQPRPQQNDDRAN